MKSIRSGSNALLALGLVAACASEPAGQQMESHPQLVAQGASASSSKSDRGKERRQIALRDDCDPRDPAWAPTGGCLLEEGDVDNKEFTALLVSPLSRSTVGHPAWTIDPSYLKFEGSRTVRVTNQGGRAHTFTEVAQFGGGKVPPLNVGLVPAPECARSTNLQPGASAEVSALKEGVHRFQCCIHPWMRALVKVKPPGDDADD